jgi:hypothetical protein
MVSIRDPILTEFSLQNSCKEAGSATGLPKATFSSNSDNRAKLYLAAGEMGSVNEFLLVIKAKFRVVGETYLLLNQRHRERQ